MRNNEEQTQQKSTKLKKQKRIVQSKVKFEIGKKLNGEIKDEEDRKDDD